MSDNLSVRTLSSLSPEEDSMSLNIFRGRQRERLSTMNSFDESKIFWRGTAADISEYEEKLHALKRKIQIDFKEEFQGCFLDETLRIDVSPDPESYPLYRLDGIMFDFANYSFGSFSEIGPDQKEVIRKLRNCLKNQSSIIAMFTVVSNSQEDDEHANILIINKIHKTVELYDPNGVAEFRTAFPEISMALELFFLEECRMVELATFEFVDIEDTNPEFGVQVFQDRFKGYNSKFESEGLCQIWVFYLAILRAEYIAESPVNFKNRIINRMFELSQRASALQIPESELLGIYMTNYIFSLLLNMDSNTSLRPRRKRKRSLSPSSIASTSSSSSSKRNKRAKR